MKSMVVWKTLDTHHGERNRTKGTCDGNMVVYGLMFIFPAPEMFQAQVLHKTQDLLFCQQPPAWM